MLSLLQRFEATEKKHVVLVACPDFERFKLEIKISVFRGR